jgi:hypothetical protein
MGNNFGEVGVDSIRINGQRIADLPLGLGNDAKDQIPIALSNERQQKIADVLARYPRVTREYLQSRMRECQTAIADFKRVKKETQEAIKDFTLLAQNQEGVAFHDIEEELYKIGHRTDLSFEERKRLIAEKRSTVSVYNPVDLSKQITNFQENIERLDDAIQAENDSVSELVGLLARIDIRDAELKSLGVTTIT